MRRVLVPFVIGLLSGSIAMALQPVTADLSLQGDTVHLELEGRQNWDYDLKKVDRKGRPVVELLVEPLDEKSLNSVLQFKNSMVKSVTVDKKAQDGKNLLTFELADGSIDSFDYLTDQPSRLIIDFFQSEKKTEKSKADGKSSGKVSNSKNSKKDSESVASGEAKSEGGVDDSRAPASDALSLADSGAQPVERKKQKKIESSGSSEKTANTTSDTKAGQKPQSGIFDGGDPNYERFNIKDYEIKEEAILRSKDNYYVPFPMLEKESEYWPKLKMAEPVYNIVPKEDDENKQARLLYTFFDKGRYNVYLKTLEWYKEKYPQSEYNEIIAFMTGDVYRRMYEDKGRSGDFQQAIQSYKEAISKYPKSLLAERTSLMIGRMVLEKGDALNAIRLFNEHIQNKNYGGDRTLSKDIARLGSALAYVKLNRYDEAMQIYSDLEKLSEFKDIRHEAAYRKGDVDLKSKNFKKSIEEYQLAIKKYPDSIGKFPNALFNQAESQFSLEQYRNSLETYREFIKKFPSHDYAAFAMTRVGELLEILGADKSLVMGAFLETHFRYGENPNATIARLRLISARMKGMKGKELDNSVKEIEDLTKKLELPHLDTFKTIMLADGYNRRGEFVKATDLLKKFYQQNPTNPDNPHITKRIVGNINAQIYSELQSGDFIQALKTHQSYADTWLKSDKRLDTKYFIGRAFEMAGVNKEAETYYRDVLNKIYAAKGTPMEKTLSVMELLPSTDQLNLRLAAVSDQQRRPAQAFEYLNSVKNPERMTDTEQIERVQLAVKLLEQKQEIDSSVRYLTELLRTWRGMPELVARPYLKLSELELKQGKKKEAVESLRKIDEMVSDGAKVQSEVHAKALENLANLYLEMGDEPKAIQYLDKLLNQYEDKRPLSSIRYKLGSLHFNKGNVQKAADVWQGFKGERSQFWRDLAQEQLKNSEWRDGYKKYIQRIPAMSGDMKDIKKQGQ